MLIKIFHGLKKLAQLLFSRMAIVALLIILQIIWIWLLFEYLADYNVVIHVLTTIIGAILLLVVVNKDEVPEYKMPWMLVIVISPILGGVLYVFFGSNQPGRLMKRQYSKIEEQSDRIIKQNLDVIESLRKENSVACAQAMYLYESSRSPVYTNSYTRYFSMGDDMFPVMVRELKKAKRFIFIEYFILEEGLFWNTILDILKQKLEEGVEVRVMYDDIGSIGKVPMIYPTKLRKMGFNAQVFRPFLPFISTVHNNRDHRKIMIVDNRVAFTGGVNLADEYINKKQRFGTWKDTGIMLEGECVSEFTAMFLTLWDVQARTISDYKKYAGFNPYIVPMPALKGKNEEDVPERVAPEEFAHAPVNVSLAERKKEEGYVVCFGDGPKPFYEEQVGKNAYLNILNNATDYVYIATPYLICDNELLSAIRLAARRGVDVRMITPRIPDKQTIYLITRSNYSTLIEAGVKIYEYTPGFIHAKNFVSDDKYAVVSTINLDYRSLVHHFECGVWMYNTPTVANIKADMLKTIGQSKQISAEEAKLNVMQNLVKSIVQIVTPLL